MKIAILTCGLLPIPAVQGGAVENLIDFYLEYNNQKKKHDITIYSPWHQGTNSHPALLSNVNHYIYINVSNLKARIARKIRAFFHRNEYYNYFIEYYFEKVFSDLENKEFDYILLENCPGFIYKLSQRGYNNLILHLHNDLLNTNSLHHDTIFNCLTKIITVSDFIKERVSTIQQSKKIQTVYNGIDLKLFSPKKNHYNHRESLGFADDDFIIVYSGRINKYKGIYELIEALAQLRNFPKIKLMVLGSTFFENASNEDEFSHSLKEKAAPIKEKIIFTGYIPYKYVANYLRLADIAVLPSMWDEPFGLTVVEAMAVGLPLITTRSGGIPEICEGVATIIERNDIVHNLSTAIINLYQNYPKRQQMATSALERVKMFNKDTYVKSFFDAIEKI